MQSHIYASISLGISFAYKRKCLSTSPMSTMVGKRMNGGYFREVLFPRSPIALWVTACKALAGSLFPPHAVLPTCEAPCGDYLACWG